MAECAIDLTGDILIAGCKKRAGLNGLVYLGLVRDIDSYTTNPTTKVIETLVLETGKRLHKYVGRIEGNTFSTEVPASDGASLYNQTFTFLADTKDELDVIALEEILNTEGLFAIYLTNNGEFKIAGINRNADDQLLNKGLKNNGSTLPEGVAINDASNATIVLSGQTFNFPVRFKVAAGTLAATRTYLEGLITPAA